MLTKLHLPFLAVLITSGTAVRTLNNEPFIGCLDDRDSGDTYVISVQCRSVTTEFVVNHFSKLSSVDIVEADFLHCKLPVVLPFAQAISRIRIVNSNVTDVDAHAFRNSIHTLSELDLSNNNLNKFPVGVQNLTELESLDLSNNNITTLPEGTQFFHLWKLRHLNLAYNRLGLIQDIQERISRGSGKPLSLTVFNIEPLREILETLNLRANKMKVLPEQFSRRFSRLRELDLSNNLISEINPEAFSNMPDLQYLNLDNNRLKDLSLTTHPLELRILSLLSNPFTYGCYSIKLRKWQSANKTWIPYEACDSKTDVDKEGLIVVSNANLYTNITSEKSLTATPQADQRETNGTTPARLVLELTAKSQSIVTVWKVNRTTNDQTGFSWRIKCRKFGTKNYTEVTGSQTRGAESSGSITFPNLLPSTGYNLCLEYTTDEVIRESICEEILTEDDTTFPTAEVAVAATVSTTSTMVVIALVCCCCPCKKCKKKKEKIPEVVKNNNDRDNEYSYPSLSAKYENLAEGYKRNCVLFPEDFSYTNFSAISSAEKEDESRRIFEETRQYLQKQRVKAILNHDERIPTFSEVSVNDNEVKVNAECHEKEDSTSSGYLTPKTNDEIDATLNFDLFKPKEQDNEILLSPEVLQKRLSIVESLQNYKEPVPKLPIHPTKRNSIEMGEIRYKRPPPPRVVGATVKKSSRHHTWSSVPVVPPTLRWNPDVYEHFLANPSIYKKKRRHTLRHAPPYMTVNRMYLVAHPGGEVKF